MPADALPQPWPTSPAGTVQYRREYRDALGRPMQRGTLTISGAHRADTDTSVTVAAPVTAELVAGVLDVALPPGDYTVTGALVTVDGVRVSEKSEFTLA